MQEGGGIFQTPGLRTKTLAMRNRADMRRVHLACARQAGNPAP
jgi:hypothetical protein